MHKLAALRGVHERTIRRDLGALERAGFPIYDDRTNGTPMWKLRQKPFSRLEETGLGIIELSALYFSRTLIETLAGAPLRDDLERAFVKLERALPPGCRLFLDRLPALLKAKVSGRKIRDEKKVQEVMTRAVDAALRRRRISMRYASVSSARTKDYIVEPLRLAYAFGGIYLQAFVPEYGEVRTFSVERIRTLGILDEQFEPRAMPVEPFADSIGVAHREARTGGDRVRRHGGAVRARPGVAQVTGDREPPRRLDPRDLERLRGRAAQAVGAGLRTGGTRDRAGCPCGRHPRGGAAHAGSVRGSEGDVDGGEAAAEPPRVGQGSGFRVQGSGFRVQGSGFRVQGSGFRVQGSGFSGR